MAFALPVFRMERLAGVMSIFSASSPSVIFRRANALDKSHRGKLRDLKITLEDDQVIFKAKASENTLLERWAFAESAQYFKEVFGLSPELSIKFDMI